MPIATDQQVQTFVDVRIRPRVEQLRQVLLGMQDDKAAIDDIYQALTQQSPTWTDSRVDGVPHLLTPSDVLAMNTLYTDLITAISENAQWPVALRACVRPAGS